MNVLVTGATGFVGNWLCQRLIHEGHNVTAIVRNPDRTLDLLPEVTVVKGDVTDPESLKKTFSGMDTIFHLAGVVGYSRAERPLMDAVNIQGTQNVIEACKSHSVRRLVYMSSVVAVGASFDGKVPLDEKSKYNLEHLNLGYFQTKHYAEQRVLKSCEAGEVDAVLLNPSTIYGPGDAKKGSRSSQLKVAQGKLPFYTSGGVSIISIDDVIEGVVQAWKIGKTGERYILSGDNITIKELFEIIADLAGVNPPSIYLPNPVVHSLGFIGDQLEKIGKKGPINSENAWAATLFHWFSNEKAKRELGLIPKNARTSIEQSIQWIKENGLLNV